MTRLSLPASSVHSESYRSDCLLASVALQDNIFSSQGIVCQLCILKLGGRKSAKNVPCGLLDSPPEVCLLHATGFSTSLKQTVKAFPDPLITMCQVVFRQ